MSIFLSRVVTLTVPALLLSGCFLSDRNSSANFTAAKLPVHSAEAPVDVPEVIRSVTCSVNGAALVGGGASGAIDAAKTLTDAEACVSAVRKTADGTERVSYGASVAGFYAVYGERTDGAFARNRVQDTIMKAADMRCGDFKVELARAGAFEETTTGIIGVLAGGLGGLMTGTDAARSLAATSGIVGGSGAVINKALFRNESLKVISSGIDMKRAELSREFDEKRGKPLSAYTLENAIRDAIRYGDACNVLEGLSKISDTVAAGGGGAAKPAEPAAGAIVGKLDELSLAQLVRFAQLDPNKKLAPALAAMTPATANVTDETVRALKHKYKADAIAADPKRLNQLHLMMNEATKP